MRVGFLLLVGFLLPSLCLGVYFYFHLMDPVDLSRLVETLKLSNEYMDNCIVLSPELSKLGYERVENCLIGKVFSSKTINRDTFRSQMPRILQACKQIDIECAGENLFILDFKSRNDRRRALLDGPWNFFRNLVLFKELAGFQNPSEVLFEEFSVWVQCHNLPVAFMHPSILRNIGDQIGQVDDIDVGEDGNCLGRFARIRVTRKLSLPLQKCVRVKSENDTSDIFIILVYERLPDFCFACGRVGHLLRECDDESCDRSNPSFGSWMRAPIFQG